MNSCCLCSTLVSADHKEFWNKPIFGSNNFLVLPSLGSLIEGWVLIVPRDHFLCMGALSANLITELGQIKNDAAEMLRRHYGDDVVAFEHGPNSVNRQIGCGVDHAHLHLVPVSFDLMNAAMRFMPLEACWIPATLETCRTAFGEAKDYLYIEQPIGNGHIATNRRFGSQVFRRAIAANLGAPKEFNWRDYPQFEIIAKTIRTLGASVNLGI